MLAEMPEVENWSDRPFIHQTEVIYIDVQNVQSSLDFEEALTVLTTILHYFCNVLPTFSQYLPSQTDSFEFLLYVHLGHLQHDVQRLSRLIVVAADHNDA